ncbi:hypothetical protein [Streptomyces sp. OP7]|uniref:hypothetical protein n=1 Tax=Streptomyces sp. OP7 TaxID=3142462 RepID=UPI0032E851F6
MIRNGRGRQAADVPGGAPAPGSVVRHGPLSPARVLPAARRPPCRAELRLG